jgi:hypothetical protein
MGKFEKKKGNNATKVTKIPKTKRRKKWDEQNICQKLNWASMMRLLFDIDFNTYQQAIFFGTSTKAW